MPDNLLSGKKKQTSNNQFLLDKAAVKWAAELLGRTWLLQIICELLEGTRRFGEIQDGLGKINPQTLSSRLKMLEHCGIVTRTAYAEIPPRVEYDLTEKGYGISEIVQALAVFGKTYMGEEPPEMPPCPGTGECSPDELL